MASSFGKTVSQVCGKLSATFKIINNEVVKRIRTMSIETLFYSETVAIATNMGRRGILSDLDETLNIKVSSQAIGKFSNKIDASHLDKIVKNLQSYFPKIRRILAVDGSVLSMSKLINIENPLFTLTPSGSYATASLTCIFDVIPKTTHRQSL